MKSVGHKYTLSFLCNLGRFGEVSNIDTTAFFQASQDFRKLDKLKHSAFQSQFCLNLQTKPFSRSFNRRTFRMFTKSIQQKSSARLNRKIRLRDSIKHLCANVKSIRFVISVISVICNFLDSDIVEFEKKRMIFNAFMI